MRGARAAGRDHADQALRGRFGQHGRGDLLAHQHGTLGIGRRLAPAAALQAHQHTSAQVADVLGSLAQIGIIHVLEDLDVLGHGLA